MILDKYRLKLQMFAEDEEIEDGDLPSTSKDNIVPDEPDNEDPEDELVDGEEDFVEDEDVDKKTKALIRWKQEAKESKKKLEELEERLKEDELKSEESQRVEELKKTGVSEDVAKRTAGAETKAKMYEAKLAKYEYADLEKTYPNIVNHTKEIEELRSKYPEMSREELYLAKFSKNANFEQRRNMEAELSYKQRIAKDKGLTDGVPQTKEKVKLTRAEEVSYREVKKFNPKMTRAQFYKSLNEEDEIDF